MRIPVPTVFIGFARTSVFLALVVVALGTPMISSGQEGATRASGPQASRGSISGESSPQTQENGQAAGVENPQNSVNDSPPAVLPKLRRIFFLPGDAPRLIPPNYWAVGIDELEAALSQRSEVIEPGVESPQLVSSLYVARFVDGALICDNESSIFDIAYRDDAPSSLLLGEMNLALAAQAPSPAQSLTAKLVTMPDGQVKAVVYRDCRLRFGWTRRGVVGADEGYQFDLRIPSCGRTRFLIGVPDAYRLTSRDGVVTQLPSPPQEVGTTGTQTPGSWYAIEAGGLSQIRLAIAPLTARSSNTQVVVVRGIAVDCRVAPSGIEWRGTIVCDLPAGQNVPTLAVIGGGKVNAVTIDGQPVLWREISNPDGDVNLQVTSGIASSTKATSKRIQLSGIGPLPILAGDEGIAQGVLPWLQIVGIPRVIAGASHQLDLSVDRPMRVASLERMEGWSVIENVTTDENQENLLRLTGPADSAPPMVSFVEVTPRPQIDSVLRLDAEESVLRAAWVARISTQSATLAPFRFRMQEGWRFDNVVIRGPERVIDLQSEEIRDGIWTLWPDASDFVDGVIRLEATGELDRVGSPAIDTVPSSWCIQPIEVAGRSLAMVTPPSGMEWDTRAAFRGRRLKSSELDTRFLEMVGPISDDTLLFDVGDGGSPELGLYRPVAAFNSETLLDFRREGEQVVETLRINFRVPAGRLTSVQVSLGAPLGRPPMQWSIFTDSNPGIEEESASYPEMGALQANLLDTDGSTEQIWDLQPTSGIFDGLVIQGERRYEAKIFEKLVSLQLPNILVSTSLPATSHRGTCTLGPGLLLLGTSDNTIKLPSNPGVGVGATVESLTSSSALKKTPGSQASSANWTVRFPGNALSSIRMIASPNISRPTIVWKQKLELLAGSSVDEITCFYTIDDATPFQLRFPREVTLVDAQGAELVRNRDEGGRQCVTITPNKNVDEVAVHWRRTINKPTFFRRFQIPDIETNAMVFSEEAAVWPASNTQLLSFVEKQTPASWMGSEASGYRLMVSDGEDVMLVTKNVAMATAGAVAMVLGVLAWIVFRFANWLSLPLLGLLVVGAMVDVSWQGLVITFGVLPWALGMLFASISSKFPGVEIQGDQSHASAEERRSKVQRTKISGREVTALLVLIFVLPASSTHAQEGISESEDPSNSGVPPVSVLIPITEDGQIAGDKVYIPGAFREMLFSVGKEKLKGEGVDFRSADYQVRVNPTGMTDLGELVSIEATWRIEVDSIDQVIYLPVSGNLLDRLELLVDGVPNEIRASVDREGVSFRPPRSGGLVIRAQLTPTVVSTVAGANRIDLAVPPCAVAGVSVVSDVAFEQISLPKCLGKIDRSDTGNRIAAEMGGADRLEIIWQRRGSGSAGNLTNFTRRWLVQIDENQISRELELAVGEGVRAGVVVDLFVDTPMAPLLTSSDWSLSRSGGIETNATRYRLIALIDNPGPIRFLWTSPVSLQNIRALQLPDIRSNTQSGKIETLVGFHLDGRWKVNLDSVGGIVGDSSGNPFETVSPEEFVSSWSGYPTRIDLARKFVRSGPVEVQLVRDELQPWRMDEFHEVILTESGVQLNYEMMVEPGSAAQPPVVLRLPFAMKVERVLWNDRELTPELAGDSRSLRLLLPELPKDRRTNCRVFGTFRLVPEEIFDFPAVRLEGLQASASNYIVRRTEGLRLRELESSPNLQQASVTPEYDLTSGTIPLRAWSLSEQTADEATSLGGKYQLRPSVEQFDSRSLTTLRWEEGSWRMETTIEVQSQGDAPDFLIFEIPTRWSQGLDVRPAAKWSVQPTLDRSRLLLRVLPETTSADRLTGAMGVTNDRTVQRITITSGLDNPGDGGVEIPDVRLLGKVESKRFFAAPKRLTSTEINWQTQNARPANLPETLSDIAPSDETHTFFEVVGDDFLATLTPSVNSEEAAFIPDHQVSVFRQESQSRFTLVQRMFVNPGTLKELKLNIPRSIRILGMWVAGNPIPSPAIETREVIVPLALSRLSQEIVLLCEVSLSDFKQTIPIVIPESVPVHKSWVAFYERQSNQVTLDHGVKVMQEWTNALFQQEASSPTISVPGDSTEVSVEEYRVSIADAIMTTLDLSVDSVAERSAQEKWQWLEPWLQQLRWLGWQPKGMPGWQPKGASETRLLDDANSGETTSQLAESGVISESRVDVGSQQTTESKPSIEQQVSTRVNQWLPRFLQQTLGADVEGFPLGLLEKRPVPRLLVPPSWNPSTVHFAEHSITEIQIQASDAQRNPDGMGLRAILACILFIGGFLGFGVMRFWFGASRCRQPNLWLIVIGFILAFVVPLPFAIAVVGLGIITPVLRQRKLRDFERSMAAQGLRGDTAL